MKNMLSTSDLLSRIEKVKSKLRPSSNRSGNKGGIGVESIMSEAKKSKVSRNKAKILKKMSPSLDRGLQILSGMIACPEGGTRTNLNYSMGSVDGLSEDKKTQLIQEIKKYCEDTLNLETGLHDMVYKVISEVGADVEVYIPMSLVDEALGLESTGYIQNNLPEDKDFKYSETHMAMGTDMALLTQTPLSLKPTVGIEADIGGRTRLSRINATTLALSTDGIVGADSVVVRRTTGEAIVPIIYNGRVIKFVGILDNLGNFVTSTDATAFQDLMSDTDESERQVMEVLASDAKIQKGSDVQDRYKEIRRSIEDDVIETITGSKSKDGLDTVIKSLGEENVIDILTARAMAAKKTRVIMIDPEYVSYFSMIDNDHGRGITIIDDNSSIILLHVTLLYAKILEELDASIPKTHATVTLDEADSNPDASLKDIMGALAENIAPDYTLNYNGNRELWGSLAKVNTSVNVEGADVPGMPKMSVDIDRTQKAVRSPDSGLLETVGKYATQTLGISSDHVDNSYAEKFKLQVSRDNDITSRQLMRYVSRVDEGLTDRGRKRISHNDELWTKLLGIIGNKANAEDILINALATLAIRLPEATSSKFEVFAENMEIISSGLTEYLENAIPDTVIEGGERLDPDSLRSMREMVAGAAIRNYASNTDLFGGLNIDLTSMAGLAEIVSGELDTYGEEFTGMIKAIRKYKKVMDKAEEKVNAEDEVPPAEDPVPEDIPPEGDSSVQDGGEEVDPEVTDPDDELPPDMEF